MSFGKRLIEYFALQRSVVGVLVIVVLVGLGERMGERFLPVYVLALGGGTLAVGLLQAVNNLISALYSYPGGRLADRLGTKRSLILFNLMAMGGFLLVAAVPAWQTVLLAAVLFLSWNAITLPGMMKLIAGAVPQRKRTMGVSLHSLIRRIPMALGPLIGGLFIVRWGEESGVRVAFVVAFVLAAVGLIALFLLIPPDPRTAPGILPGHGTKHRLRPLARNMSPALGNLLLSDVLIRFCEQIPYAFVVIWCMQTITAPVSAWQFGVLTAIEMITAVLIYVPAAHFADRYGKEPFVLLTFVFFSLFPLALMHCNSFGALAAAFVLRGLKEFGEPTRKALILDLCPEEGRASMFGFYYLVRDSVVSIGALSGAFLWSMSPALNLWTSFFFGTAGTIWFAVFGCDMFRKRFRSRG